MCYSQKTLLTGAEFTTDVASLVNKLDREFSHRKFVFVCDNLNAHQSHTLGKLLVSHGHRYVLLPKYSPLLNPIEESSHTSTLLPPPFLPPTWGGTFKFRGRVILNCSTKWGVKLLHLQSPFTVFSVNTVLVNEYSH